MAGFVASSLIGAVYFSPFVTVTLALLRRRNRQTSGTHYGWFSIAIMASLIFMGVGEMLSLRNVLMLGTSVFVLATLSLSAVATGAGTIQMLKRHTPLGSI